MSNYLIGMIIYDKIELIHSIKAENRLEGKKRYKEAFRHALRPTTSSDDDNIVVIGEYKDGFLELDNDIVINKNDKKISKDNNKNNDEMNDCFSNLNLSDSPKFEKPDCLKNNDEILFMVYNNSEDARSRHTLLIRAKSKEEAREKYLKTLPVMFTTVYNTAHNIKVEEMHLYYVEYSDIRGDELIYDTDDMKVLTRCASMIEHNEFLTILRSLNNKQKFGLPPFRNIVKFKDWDDAIKSRVKRKYPNWKGGEYEF